MALFRTVLFWFHLAAGILAGAVVLIMAITGVALTFEKQLVEWADRQARVAPASPAATTLPPEALLARVRQARPGAAPTTLTLRADPDLPAVVALEGAGAVLVDPYRGSIIGPANGTVRTFFRSVTSWHRWLAMEGPARPWGKSITGAANLAFLFLVLSGLYLWVPRVWSRTQLRSVIWFRSGLRGKARDFNWHHAIGIWSAIPLAMVVAGAVPISYSWASGLVYRAAGEEPPRPSSPPPVPAEARTHIVELAGLDTAARVAATRIPGWRTIVLRVPAGTQRTLTVIVDEGYGGQPQKRATLTVDRQSGALERWERFADQTRGRQWRSWLRFVHTGEYYGLAGQAIAGLASLGAVVLVWTGLSLAARRVLAWRGRGRRIVEAVAREAA